MFELVPSSGIRFPRRLLQEMDELWSRFLDPALQPSAGGNGPAFVPVMNVKETDAAIEITAEVPGLAPEEIEVTLTGDLLTIKGEKKEEHEEKKGSYHLVERRFGSFQRTFRLPTEVKTDKLEARHKDGVLRVILPKSAKAAAKTVKVKPE